MGRVVAGLIPAPATYRSLPAEVWGQPHSQAKEEGNDSYSLPMEIGRPLAPKSPRPRMRDPAKKEAGVSGRPEWDTECIAAYRL